MWLFIELFANIEEKSNSILIGCVNQLLEPFAPSSFKLPALLSRIVTYNQLFLYLSLFMKDKYNGITLQFLRKNSIEWCSNLYHPLKFILLHKKQIDL